MARRWAAACISQWVLDLVTCLTYHHQSPNPPSPFHSKTFKKQIKYWKYFVSTFIYCKAVLSWHWHTLNECWLRRRPDSPNLIFCKIQHFLWALRWLLASHRINLQSWHWFASDWLHFEFLRNKLSPISQQSTQCSPIVKREICQTLNSI